LQHTVITKGVEIYTEKEINLRRVTKSRAKLVKDDKGDVLTDSQTFLNRYEQLYLSAAECISDN
jgi:hypothetical protein